jgi:hypothetical protein
MLIGEIITPIFKEFEALHGIPYITGAIDSSYMTNIAPSHNGLRHDAPSHDASTYYN